MLHHYINCEHTYCQLLLIIKHIIIIIIIIITSVTGTANKELTWKLQLFAANCNTLKAFPQSLAPFRYPRSELCCVLDLPRSVEACRPFASPIGNGVWGGAVPPPQKFF